MIPITLSRSEIQLILDTKMALIETSNSFSHGDPRKEYFARLSKSFKPILERAYPDLFPLKSR